MAQQLDKIHDKAASAAKSLDRSITSIIGPDMMEKKPADT
jgi:hypothetical protein